MSGISNQSVLTPRLREIVQEELRGGSVITTDGKLGGGLTKYDLVTGAPAKEPGTVLIGTGKALPGFVFSPQPGAFDPSGIMATAQPIAGEVVAPARPRRASCTTTYLNGIPSENTQTILTWAPPVVDSTGRWLEHISGDYQGSITEDSLLYYMVRRTTVQTGEVVTVGMVPHSKQTITAIRQFLETEKAAGRNGATTDVNTRVATIDSALFLNVLDINGDPILDSDGHNITELVIPDAHDAFFSFTDTTTQHGLDYLYTVTAITDDQHEGTSVTINPGTPQAAGGVTIAFPTAWASSFPDVGAGAPGTDNTAYLDLTVQIGSLLTDVDVSLIPVMDNALNIDITGLPSTDPYIVQSLTAETKFSMSDTTKPNTAVFIGRNFDTNGGTPVVVLPNSVSIVSFTKGAQVPGTSTDFEYTLVVNVSPTATPGPTTIRFQFGNGKELTWSHVFIQDTTSLPALQGASFATPGNTYRRRPTDPRTLIIQGTRLDTIQSVAASPALTTFTITSQTDNTLTLSYTAFTGTVALVVTLKPTFVATGKTTASLCVTTTLIDIVRGFVGNSDSDLQSITVTRDHDHDSGSNR